MSMISRFKNVKDTSNPFHKSIDYALKRIRDGKSKELVQQIRKLPKDKANQLKQNLPSICFQGKFKYRNDASLIQHSGFVILDFDNIEDVASLKKKLATNEYVYAAWVSPSGNGIKALTRIPPEKDNHKQYFLAIEKYFVSFATFQSFPYDNSTCPETLSL